MNKHKLLQSRYHRVRLHPAVRSKASRCDRVFDWEWMIDAIDVDRGVHIRHPDTGYIYCLGFDHIHQYVSEPARQIDGLKHGVLDLNIQLVLDGDRITFTPIRKKAPNVTGESS